MLSFELLSSPAAGIVLNYLFLLKSDMVIQVSALVYPCIFLCGRVYSKLYTVPMQSLRNHRVPAVPKRMDRIEGT